MTSRLETRLSRLEANSVARLGAWGRVTVNLGEDRADAVFRTYGDNPPPNLIYRIIVESPHAVRA